MMVEFESTSSIQPKCKPRKPHQNQSKLPLINPPIVLDNISIQEPLIAPTSIMTTPDSKVKESTPEPNLMEASNSNKNKDINIDEVGLLVKRESI